MAFTSYTLTPTEKNYTQIEKECPAACKKFNQYVTGLNKFWLLTNHKPLVSLMNTQVLNKYPFQMSQITNETQEIQLQNTSLESFP